jgi:hypothetical protein
LQDTFQGVLQVDLGGDRECSRGADEIVQGELAEMFRKGFGEGGLLVAGFFRHGAPLG